MAKATMAIQIRIADLPKVKAEMERLAGIITNVRAIRDALTDTLNAGEIVDPIGCLETLLIQLNQATCEHPAPLDISTLDNPMRTLTCNDCGTTLIEERETSPSTEDGD